MASFIAVSYVRDDGTRTEYTCPPGSRGHREALEHERAGACVVIEEIAMDMDESLEALL